MRADPSAPPRPEHRAMRLRRRRFGTAPDGTPVDRWTLADPDGISASVLTYGAILQSCVVPAPDGTPGNVVLALAELGDYAADPAYLGAVVGRYANRIAGGRFSLDGVTYTLPTNDRGNTLHGGPHGFHRQVWQASGFTDTHRAGVTLQLSSPHGDMGFPGTLHTQVTYTVERTGMLTVDYQATTDRPTVVNLTQHAYWNLAGGGDILGHQLSVEAAKYLPVDATGIPLGAPEPVSGTPFELRRSIGQALHDEHPQITAAGGIDHCFVLNGGRTDTPRFAARLTDPGSGRVMETWTTEPGLQVYTANHLDVPFAPRAGACLETQHFPNAPNRPDFPSTVLRPGQTYRSTTEYRFAHLLGNVS